VTVYEQAPSLKALGAGITLAPNAVRALDWLGLGDRLQSKGMAHGEAAIRDQRGRWLFRAPVEALEERFGVASFALHRADLHAMLVHAARKATLRTRLPHQWSQGWTSARRHVRGPRRSG
jgi:2-polyprenyl-6-methoxyphenol hydroxylase-like FAD-dependent oxidoreductase